MGLAQAGRKGFASAKTIGKNKGNAKDKLTFRILSSIVQSKENSYKDTETKKTGGIMCTNSSTENIDHMKSAALKKLLKTKKGRKP